MQEPVVNANGMTDDEIYQWMDQKIAAARRLNELQSTKAELEERLNRIEGEIEEATVQSRVDISRQSKKLNPKYCGGIDPIYHETMVKALRLEIEELKGSPSQGVSIINQTSHR